MSRKAVKWFLLWMVYFALAFPMFYFVYKFGDPILGANDFFSYYKLYLNWDIKSVDAPFNMRLLSSFFVYLLNKSGLHYETKVAFEHYDLSKQVYFNAVFFNFLCVASTCTLVFLTVFKFHRDALLAFLAGLLYLLGFGTLFYEFMPLTDACSVLLCAWIFYNYLSKSYFVLIPLSLLVLQREYIYMAFGLIALLDYIKYRDKYFVHIILTCATGFTVYYILRKTVFYTPLYDHQASPSYFLDSIFTLKFPLIPYLRQTLMTLNIVLIYFGILLYKKYKGLWINSYEFWKIVFLFLQINIISFAAVFGNNTGRYFYILIPIIIFYLVAETRTLLKS